MNKQNPTWDLSPLFPTLTSWKQALKKELSISYDQLFSNFKNKKTLSCNELKGLLDLYFKKEREIKKLYTWAHLFFDQETSMVDGREAYSSSLFCLQKFKEATSWIEPSIIQQNEKQFTSFLSSSHLAQYKVYLSNLKRVKKHTLSLEEESLMAMSEKTAPTAYKAFSALNDTDLSFPEAQDKNKKKHPVSHGSFQQLLRSSDRTLRKNAYSSIHGTYAAFKNSFAELLSGEMNRHCFEREARKYSSCLEASLYPKAIPLSIYTNLLSTVNSQLAPLHNYIKLRKKALSVTSLEPYDLYAPLIKQHKERLYTYEEAAEMVLQSCALLGKKYTNTLRKGLLKDRWVDIYEKKSKRSGAYSSGCYDSYPYILLNFKGTLRDVYTLAHEAGHSMHSFLSRNKQPYHLSEYEIFVAEVASTVHEELLTHFLKNEKIDLTYLIVEQIEQIRATFFRQTLFADFELFLHTSAEKGVPLTSDLLETTYLELNKKYYGPDLHCTKELGCEWARIPHFYYNFYVYQYATGISAAHSLKEGFTTQGKKGIDRYLNFLSSGSSASPVELLQKAGVDLTTCTPFIQLIQTFDTLVKSLEIKNLALK